MDYEFTFLEPERAHVLSDAIRTAYGDSYDAKWVYDNDEVAARLADGRYISCVAQSAAGDLLCHAGMSRSHPEDAVGHSGQAVTMPEARGRHLFTKTKQRLMDRAREDGMAGLYSEATAAHPYSQKANVDLGAHETGFLLGWIPATVDNDAAARSASNRQSAALFYAKLNDGRMRSIYAPEHYREIVEQTVDICKFHGSLAVPDAGAEPQALTEFAVEVDSDHNLAIIDVVRPGADLDQVIGAERRHRFHHGIDAIYVDLPLDDPATALVSDRLRALGVSYCGIFPNRRADGDVLRLQSLHRVRVTAEDVAVASDHGRALLEFVLDDLPTAEPA